MKLPKLSKYPIALAGVVTVGFLVVLDDQTTQALRPEDIVEVRQKPSSIDSQSTIIRLQSILPFLIIIVVVTSPVLVTLMLLKTNVLKLIRIARYEVGIVYKKLGNSTSSLIALNKKESGWQAEILTPGVHWFFSFMHKVYIDKGIYISSNEVGLVEAKDGAPLPVGRMFGDVVNCSNFQDARAFLINGGQRGKQLGILTAGIYRINTKLFNVKIVDTISIQPDQIGLVIAKDGAPLPNGRILGKVVKCNDFQDGQAFIDSGGEKGRQLGILATGEYQINTDLFIIVTAKNATEHGMKPEDLRVYTVSFDKIGIVTTLDGATLPEGEIAGSVIEDRNYFQNPQKFIDAGGCRGLQEEILPAGSWLLNPWFVRVEQVPLTEIPVGTVGVVISYVGKNLNARDPKDESQSESLVNRGYKGIEKTPLRPGKYPINLKLKTIEMVPIHEITLNWSNMEKPSFNYDRNLYVLEIQSKDGFVFELEVILVIRIKPEDAPKMIARIGYNSITIDELSPNKSSATVKFNSIKMLVTRVLEPIVGNYFRNTAREFALSDFFQNRSEIELEAKSSLEKILDVYGVQTISLFINKINLPSKLKKILSRRNIAQLQTNTFQIEQLAELERQRLSTLQSLPKEEIERLQNKVIREISDPYLKELQVEILRGSGMVINQPTQLVLRLINSNPETLSPIEIKLSEESPEYKVIGDNPIILSQIESQESREVSFTLLMKIEREVAINYKINNVLQKTPIYVNVVQDNPYIYGAPVEAQSSFFGRKRELEQIIQAVIKPTKQDILLIGERRTGKTSLLNQLKKRLTGSFIPVNIVLNTSEAKTENILTLVMQEVIKSLIKKGFPIDKHLQEDSNGSNFIDNLEKSIETVQPEKSGIKIVLLIDEADYLLQVKRNSSNIVDAPRSGSLRDRAQNILRAALQSSEIGNYLRAVVVGTRELSTYVSQRSSPFFNHFRFVNLRLFSTDETRELIVKPAASLEYQYTEEAIGRITNLSGGQPYYCQAICYESFNSAMESKRKQITEEDVDIAEKKIIEDFFAGYLSGFWNRFSKLEKSFVLGLARGKLNSSVKKLEIKRLLEWQIIAEGSQDNYYFPSGLIKKWTLMAAQE